MGRRGSGGNPGVAQAAVPLRAGFAGVFGYAWVTVLHLWLGVTFKATLLAANGFTAAWLSVYNLLLQRPRRDAAAYQRVPTLERITTAGTHRPASPTRERPRPPYPIFRPPPIPRLATSSAAMTPRCRSDDTKTKKWCHVSPNNSRVNVDERPPTYLSPPHTPFLSQPRSRSCRWPGTQTPQRRMLEAPPWTGGWDRCGSQRGVARCPAPPHPPLSRVRPLACMPGWQAAQSLPDC